MTDTLETPEIARIRGTLEARPTPGPWRLMPKESKPYLRIRGTQLGLRFKIANVLTPSMEKREDDETLANAEYIAACNPEAMAVLLAHIDAQAAEIERLRGAGDALHLMARLNINVSYRENIHGAWVVAEHEGINFCPESLDGPHEYDATIRAIVRAAAEIGKAMK